VLYTGVVGGWVVKVTKSRGRCRRGSFLGLPIFTRKFQHENECIKEECKNKYYKEAGKCKYGDRDDWKKVVDRKCNVEWRL
jgi:hypothetical protein